ncbi:uncharacterized protein [Miscanthus floridulus]|uniref:uncharacterized protein isoform X2 n=1 Tax=Miscanthus floridulus TaxID=154761 RepID=UPI0034575296
MATRALSVSSLASTAFASLPRPRRPSPSPPLLRLLGPRFRVSSLSTAAAAAAPDDEDGVDTVEQLLHPRPPAGSRGRIDRHMKLQRRADGDAVPGPAGPGGRRRWFPYLDAFRPAAGGAELSSGEVIEVLEPHILEARRDRLRRAVGNRSYAVCLVVEGLSDFGNVSAAFRSADALGVQSVHVISCDSSKRYRDNRHVSMGAEKWLDIEIWNSPAECFSALKKRGYRIATTYLGTDSRQDASIKENICCETVLLECLVNGHYVLSEDTQSIKLCVTNGFLRFVSMTWIGLNQRLLLWEMSLGV